MPPPHESCSPKPAPGLRKRGRPLKASIDAEAERRILQALASGNDPETAASYAGIHKTTFYAWRRRGAREKHGPFRAFYDAVEKARADAEVRNVAQIAKAAEKSWQAAAWLLERRYPNRWGRRDPKGYSAEQFTLVVTRMAELVRKHLPRDKRLLFQQELTTLLQEQEQRCVGRAA